MGQSPDTDATLTSIAFFIPRRPAVQGNSSVIRKNRKTGKRFVGKSERTRSAQAEVALLASPHLPRVAFAKADFAIRLDVVFVFEPPPSWDEWKRLEALDGRYYPTEEHLGDRDNLHKLLADALEKAGFFESDSQLVDGVVAKRYGPHEGYAIQITALPQSKARMSYRYPGELEATVRRSLEQIQAALPAIGAA